MKVVKRIAIAFGCLLLLCGLLLGIMLLLRKKTSFNEKKDNVYYYSEDYSEDIFEDPLFLAKNRDILYTENGLTLTVTKDNMYEFGSGVRFFIKYFDIVSEGRYSEYKELFSNEFFKTGEIPDKFTMQRVYDIEVKLYERIVDEASSEVNEYYIVSYKIMRNNGSFRADMGSNKSVPVVFKLTNEVEPKISEIMKMKTGE